MKEKINSKEKFNHTPLSFPKNKIRDLELMFMSYRPRKYSSPRKKSKLSRYSLHNWDRNRQKSYRKAFWVILFICIMFFFAIWTNYYNKRKLLKSKTEIIQENTKKQRTKEASQTNKSQKSNKNLRSIPVVKKVKPKPQVIPSPNPIVEQVPNLPPSTFMFQTYTVKKGDTLSSIAQNILKDTNRYKEIKEINKLESDNLKLGKILKLPIQ